MPTLETGRRTRQLQLCNIRNCPPIKGLTKDDRIIGNFASLRLRRYVCVTVVLTVALIFVLSRMLMLNKQSLEVVNRRCVSLKRFGKYEAKEDSSLKLFKEEEYNADIVKYPVNKSSCKIITALNPNFFICPYSREQDQYISEAYNKQHAWEPHISHFIQQALDYYKDAIFLDLGANIGSHSLFAAAMGSTVWSVEPLTGNLNRIYLSASLQGSLQNMRLLQNVIDCDRKIVQVGVQKGNIGGSHIAVEEDINSSKDEVDAVLLSDVFNAILRDNKSVNNVTVIIKADIELFEARAFLGSPGIFDNERFFIPYILMEWHFKNCEESNEYANICSNAMIAQMTDLFVFHGYEAYGEDASAFYRRWLKLNEADSVYWKSTNVLWRHKDAPIE